MDKMQAISLIIMCAVIAVGAFVVMSNQHEPTHSISFTLTGDSLVVANNGTTPLVPFNFTVELKTQKTNNLGYDESFSTLVGSTNSTLNPNEQMHLLPGDYGTRVGGSQSYSVMIASVQVTYDQSTYTFEAKNRSGVLAQF